MRYLDLVAGPALRFRDKTAVVGSGRRISFTDLNDRTGRLGRALRTLGLLPGARVALLSANEPEYIEAQAACLRYGYALVPLNIRLAERELGFILEDCTPAVLLVGRTQAERGLAAAKSLGIDHVFGFGEDPEAPSYERALAAQTAPSARELGADDSVPQDPDLIATILYTSGTTGLPKGAMIDRMAFTARVLVNNAELHVGPDDVHMASLPMFHIAAFLAYAHITTGAAVVMIPDFDAQLALQMMARERVSTTVLVPTIISMMLDSPAFPEHDISALRLIIYGGSSIEPGPLRRALAGFGCQMLQQYGMTESGASTILRPPDHDPSNALQLASAGSEAVSFEVLVVDHAEPVATGDIGEIVCRGPSMMRGYWNRPEETAAALVGGWMHTGDMGYRDEYGYLHVTDRRNDMIISGGENVYPREVEAALMEHPDVSDIAVVGIFDERWGEIVIAVMVDPAPSDNELASWARARLAEYKVPRRWIRVDELPRNATGKVLKHELRTMLRS